MSVKNKVRMSKKGIIRVTTVVGVLLLVLLLANSLISGWNWGLEDFVFAAVMFFCAGVALEIAFGKLKNSTQRALASITILAALALVWIQLAVGFFD